MNLYLSITKALLNKENYERFYNDISFEYLEKNNPEIYRLVQTLPIVHRGGKDDYSIDDLEVAFYGAYPKADHGLYNHLIGELRKLDVDGVVIKESLSKMREREIALRVAKEALKVAEGMGDINNLVNLLDNYEEEDDQEEDEFVTQSIREILDERANEPGLRWRLPSLNESLGSLRRGNFGFVFARPETGKTTFLSSEVTYMASNLREDQGPILWINNEQDGKEVRLYNARSALGLTDKEYHAIMDVDEQFLQVTHGKILLKDDAGITKGQIEELCRRYRPSLVLIDQIDNIKGFAADRNDLELKAIYVWARELAKKYCPVIGICQAGASADGKKWLTMNDVDNSKTGKQGTADWILGIGKTFEPGEQDLRFFYLSKNKLQGDADTDPQRRHDRWAVLIKPEIGRYVDLHQG